MWRPRRRRPATARWSRRSSSTRPRDLLPGEHFLDAGYRGADQLVTSRTAHGVDLIGPLPAETSWQAKAPQGFATACCGMDWEARRAICPQGHRSTQRRERRDHRGHAVVHIKFARAACAACPVRAQCTQAASGPRTLLIRDREHYEALQAARQRQATEAFRQHYAARAGVEGTISQGVRVADLRRARYVGLAKTRLQHLLTATGLNVLRLGAWLGERPRAGTRRSPFAALAAA